MGPGAGVRPRDLVDFTQRRYIVDFTQLSRHASWCSLRRKGPYGHLDFRVHRRHTARTTRSDVATKGPRGPLRAAARDVRLDARGHRRIDVAPGHRARPAGRPDRVHLGRHRHPSDHGDLDADLGQARRSVRPQAADPVGSRAVRARDRCGGLLAGRRHPDRVPRRAGPGRRWTRRPQPGVDGRHHQPA